MKTIQDIIDSTGRFISVNELTGYERNIVYDAVKDGVIVKIRSGVYATADALADTMVDIEKIIPDGIICLWTAWSIYGLTTQIPNAYYVAVEKKRKITLPEYPEFQLVYQSMAQLEIGATYKSISGYNVKIFDIERCVCDAVKHRNKIGIDVMAEIVQNYLRSEHRDISKLMSYASQLRVASTLNKYLELWQ